MELLIDAKLMDRFLSMRPKVFLAASDGPCDLNILSAGAEPLCDVWVVELAPGREQALLRLQPQSAAPPCEWVAPLQPPATLCILAARAPAACADLEAFRGWWAAHSPGPGPAIHVLNGSPAEAAQELLPPLLRTALAELRQSATQHASLAAQLYTLRLEHEQTRTGLKGLQTQQDRFQQGTQLAGNLPPAGLSFTPVWVSGTLTQYLPITAEGLASFDLHFPRIRQGPGFGHLLVTLYALDRDQPLGCWRVPTSDLRTGWIRFAFEEALTLAAHDLQLSVSWYGPGEVMPDLSLANVGDWNEMQAQTGEGAVLDGGLAVMLWSAAPGTRLQGGLPRGTCLPGRSCEFRLSASELARAMLSSAGQQPHPDPNTLAALPGGGLLLHPLGYAANTAFLPNACLAGIEQVSATVKIDHPQAASHVQFAMLATRHEPVGALLDLADPRSDPRVLAFSGWDTVPPDQQFYVVCLPFAEPLEHPAHLVFATRSNESTSYAWAHWLEFRMRFRAPVRVFESDAGQRKVA